MSVRQRVRLVSAGIVALGVALGGAASARGADLTVDGRPVQRLVVTTGPTLDPVGLMDAPMARSVAGVISVLEGQRLRAFQAALQPAAGEVQGADEPMCHLHLVADGASRAMDVLPAGARTYLIRGGDGAAFTIDKVTIDELLAQGPAYRGRFESRREGPPMQQNFELDRPYARSPIQLDQPTLSARLFGGSRANATPAVVDLEEELFVARLPAGYDPRRPAGLMVWCSPVEPARVPRVFHQALDELGFVGTAVRNAGNERDNNERMQLMLDVTATAMRQFHIDPRRVYMTGMSGGGRVTSIMVMCFPEVYLGGVPIVGFSSYNRVRDIGAYFAKPRGEVLRLARQRPMGMLSGPPDFNFKEMMDRKRRLERDGFSHLRMFEHAEMGHDMPQPEWFLEALAYVDEVYQDTRSAETALADAMWSSYESGRQDLAPAGEEDRAALVEIVRAGPWTAPAWQALDLLRQDAAGSTAAD